MTTPDTKSNAPGAYFLKPSNRLDAVILEEAGFDGLDGVVFPEADAEEFTLGLLELARALPAELVELLVELLVVRGAAFTLLRVDVGVAPTLPRVDVGGTPTLLRVDVGALLRVAVDAAASKS